MGSIYCDRTADRVVYSAPSWHDNTLSAHKEGGVRSPLSVIGRSPGGRKLMRGDLAAQKTAVHSGDLASAKKAVAELIAAVEMDNRKENASPHSQRKQLRQATPSSVDKEIAVKAGMLVEQKDQEFFDDDVENKENVFHGWSADETVEISDDFDVDRVVSDTVQELDRQARTLRRRSQLSTDSCEYENILQQLKMVRQRQAELEKLQTKLHSRLLRCRPTSADEQPLNLKLSSAGDVDSVTRDTVQPLDLRIPSVKECREFTHDNNERVILADITSKVVGDADPDDCFEVPDSPPPTATNAQDSGPVDDADGFEDVVPVCENFARDREGSLYTQTDGDFAGNDGQMKSTPVRSSPADCSVAHADKAAAVVILDQYLATLNVSDISEADTPSPTAASVASPDTSSEFSNYQTYQRSLDVSGRCLDPIAAALFDGDKQVCYLHQ